MTTRLLEPIHPGEILEQEFMLPLGLSANALAKAVKVPVTRVSDIVRGRRGITADTALRFGQFFRTSPELWLGLQSEYDLRMARRQVGREIEQLKSALPEDDPEYRRLLQEHRSHEERLQTLASKPRLFQEEEIEEKRLKKEKQTRDRRRTRRFL